jgi:hypothetical protein
MKDNRVARLNTLGGGTRTGLRKAYRELISISRNLSSRDWLKRLRRMEFSFRYSTLNQGQAEEQKNRRKERIRQKVKCHCE